MKIRLSLGVILIVCLAWIPYAGTPTWPGQSGYHYVVDLNTTSFAPGSWSDRHGQLALADWRDIGATSFRPGIRRANPNFNDHADGRSAWVWLNRPQDAWLAVTFVSYQGANLLDCDMWFNARAGYSWTTGLKDPGIDRPYWPIDFRAVARHEVGHAIGFDHENRTLSTLNGAYTHGAGVPHDGNTGMLPHAEDKEGGRALYPGGTTSYNVMATRWREPAAGTSGARWLDTNGIWSPGSRQKVSCYLENQSSTTIRGGKNGLKVGVYASVDNQITTSDHLLSEHWFATDWPAGGAGHFVLDADVPMTLPSSHYFVGVIFDSSGLVTEQFETDNACVVGEVDVPSTGRWANFGAGCAGSNGLAPSLSGLGTPRSGQIATVQINGLPSSGPVWMLIGLSNVNSGPIPLPFSLSGIGMPGCSALISGDATHSVVNFAGIGIWSAPLINMTPGLVFYLQAVVSDPGANSLGLTVSDALFAHVGN